MTLASDTLADDTVEASTFAYDGPPELQPAITAALTSVVDPELALSIVDVGLVYSVHVRGGKAVVRMTMTSPACPVADVILDDVENALDRVLPTGLVIDVDLCWEPAWAPTMMSARAKRFMQW